MLVSHILKSKPSTALHAVSPQDRVSDAASLLSKERIGCVIVQESDAMCGILSERDIVRELGQRGTACLEDQVSALMTSDIVTCSGGQSAEDVLRQMTEGRFRHMPVMEAGRLVGMISIGDVVKARLSELSMEKEALEGMIMGH